MTIIDHFAGEHAFLSNFATALVRLDDRVYASVEHAYQAAKSLDPQKRQILSWEFNPELTAGQAKRIGQNLKLRVDWEQVKMGVMYDLLWDKFTIPQLRDKLLATGDAELIEGNWWHDCFWGVCRGTERCRQSPHEPTGDNHLGKLLMKIREEIRKGNL